MLLTANNCTLSAQTCISLFRYLFINNQLTCLLNIAISSVKDSDEQTSPPCTPGSRGVHVANSHFSNINANNGNNGCLQENKAKIHY